MFKSLSLPAILQFSKFVIDGIEPFLQFFLPEDLLAVFLHHRLKTLILNIMTCFIRPEVLETKSSVKKLMRIYPSNHKNILSCDGINVAFVARKVPPLYMKDGTSMSLCCRFKKLFKCSDECGWILSKTADRAEIEYRKFISEAKIMEEMSKFEMSDRLDKFYAKWIWEVVKSCLILSHGNARVESSFSSNDK